MTPSQRSELKAAGMIVLGLMVAPWPGGLLILLLGWMTGASIMSYLGAGAALVVAYGILLGMFCLFALPYLRLQLFALRYYVGPGLLLGGTAAAFLLWEGSGEADYLTLMLLASCLIQSVATAACFWLIAVHRNPFLPRS